MAQVRVVLGLLSPLFGDIVRRLLAAEPDIAVVGEAADTAALADAVRRHLPHAVVVEMEGDVLPPALCGLLCELPGLSWIGVARDHSRATVLALHRDALPDVGARDLVTAVRAAAPKN